MLFLVFSWNYLTITKVQNNTSLIFWSFTIVLVFDGKFYIENVWCMGRNVLCVVQRFMQTQQKKWGVSMSSEYLSWAPPTETPSKRVHCTQYTKCIWTQCSCTQPPLLDVLNSKILYMDGMYNKVLTVLFMVCAASTAIHWVWGPTKWAGKLVIRSLAVETPFFYSHRLISSWALAVLS